LKSRARACAPEAGAEARCAGRSAMDPGKVDSDIDGSPDCKPVTVPACGMLVKREVVSGIDQLYL
jgi:hypothetical protein